MIREYITPFQQHHQIRANKIWIYNCFLTVELHVVVLSTFIVYQIVLRLYKMESRMYKYNAQIYNKCQ